MTPFEAWVERLLAWASARPDLIGVAIVGSYARGAAGPSSDIDVVLVAERGEAYLDERGWLEFFGAIESVVREDYGLVQSLRVHYQDGPEVEWGVTDRRWCAVPADPETAGVVRAGMRIVFDRDGCLVALQTHVAGS